jgi:hypothetical protein
MMVMMWLWWRRRWAWSMPSYVRMFVVPASFVTLRQRFRCSAPAQSRRAPNCALECTELKTTCHRTKVCNRCVVLLCHLIGMPNDTEEDMPTTRSVLFCVSPEVFRVLVVAKRLVLFNTCLCACFVLNAGAPTHPTLRHCAWLRNTRTWGVCWSHLTRM